MKFVGQIGVYEQGDQIGRIFASWAGLPDGLF
jgi:hypothetical protein